MSGLGEFETSYFSEPSSTLDPKLFEGRRLKGWVRQGILHILDQFFSQEFRHHELWAHPWLAGSAVSYQWQAHRAPGDLDCLIGVNYVQFRKANPEYAGLNDVQISTFINDKFKEELQPKTEDWHGFELTFYVNPGSEDIRNINPYAAYSLKYDEWTVPPDPSQSAPEFHQDWEVAVDQDYSMAKSIHTRFTAAINEVKQAHHDALRRNAEVRMDAARKQAESLFDEIHSNRREAFSMTGAGYYDFNNYRWQAAKRTGTLPMLKEIRSYGQPEVELPSAATLLVRAATYRAKM